jgi:hypothetical protein
VIFILARGGQSYARLRCNVGPGAELKLPVDVAFDRPFDRSDREAWQAEYEACVRVPEPKPILKQARPATNDLEMAADHRWRDDWDDSVAGEQLFEEAEYGFIRDYF